MTRDELRESIIDLIKMLDKAISMERHARDFYAAAARQTDAPQGKRMFEWLAQFEAGHKARLESRRNDFASHDALDGTDLPLPEDYDISETGGPIRIPENPTDTEIIKIAIDNELKAYSFYQRKMTHAKDESVKNLLENLSADEDRHMKILRDQLQHLEVNRMWTEMNQLEEQIQKFTVDSGH